MRIYADNLSEWRAGVDKLKKEMRTWRGCMISLMCSGVPRNKDVRDSGTGVIYVYSYNGPEFALRSYNGPEFVLRSTCDIPDEEKFIEDQVVEELLDEGYAVSVPTGTHITHLLHRGYHEQFPNMRWQSFGLRLSDDDAVEQYLRYYSSGGYSLLKIEEGTYCDFHP